MAGKLTVYIGYAVGVGKTYSMLQDAHTLIKNGIDVVIGYMEPHNRIDTIQLAEGIESVVPTKIQYHNLNLSEVNISAIITRNPKIVLIDEIAHTNAPESSHIKRYEDALEILDAGIDVYTTMNIQHLESLYQKVFDAIGLRVNEQIPDKIIENAILVKNIDIPPSDLIDRILSGKIFSAEQIPTALSNFFSERKLEELRTITLWWCKKHKKFIN